MKIKINENRQSVSVEINSKLDIAHVVFEIKYINGEQEYCFGTLFDENEELIDNTFHKNEKYVIEYDFKVHHKNNKEYIDFLFVDSKDEEYEINVLDINDNVYDMSNLLGKAKMYMLRSAFGPNESYVIVFPNKEVVVIDGGHFDMTFNGVLFKGDEIELAEIIRNNGGKVSKWFFTHYHSDHISVLSDILNKEEYKDIVIDEIYYDFSGVEEAFKRNGLNGSDGEFDIKLWRELEPTIEKSSQIKQIKTPHKGDRFTFGEDFEIIVLNDANFDTNSNWGNNSSVTYKLNTPNKSVIFLGDLGDYGDKLLEDEFYAKNAFDAEIVQLAHHGQHGCSKEFYSKFKNIEIALYPGADWIFRNYSDPKKIGLGPLATLDTRSWMREFKVKRTFNGNKTHLFK